MTSYKIYRSSSSSGPWTLIDTVSASPGNLTSQTANVRRFFRVDKLVDDVRIGSYLVPVLTADVPASISATGGTEVSFVPVSWSSTCSNLYNLYRSVDDDPYTLIGQFSSTTYDDHSIGIGHTYHYKVSSVTSDGFETTTSSVASATVTEAGIFTMSQARSALYQGIQIGEQTSFGTLVSATKRIANVPEFEPKEIIKVKGVNTSGVRGLTGKQRGPEHTEARFSAALDFYLFSMFMDTMFGKATPVVASGVGTRTYAPSAVAQIAPRFLTIESGSAVGAEKFGDALVTGMSVKWSKEMADMEGTIVGTELLTGITPTTGLDMMMNQAVNPIAVSAFLSTDNGSTYNKVADVIEGELRFEGMREPKFYSDSDEPSFNKWVEKIPDFGASLTLELGSEHDTMLARVKTNEVVWLGFKCLGSLISGSTYHEIKAYMPMYVMQPDRGKKDTVMGNTFTFSLAHEDTSKTIANVVTKLASGSLL